MNIGDRIPEVLGMVVLLKAFMPKEMLVEGILKYGIKL